MDKDEFDRQCLQRLDTAIDKLTDVSNEIKQVLIVHETKLEQQDRYNQQYRDDVNNLHRRIGELRDEMVKRLSDLEKWRWIMIGGAIVVGSVIGNSKLMTIFMG